MQQVSLLISEEVVDKSNEDNEVLSTSGGFTNVSIVQIKPHSGICGHL